MRANRSTPLIEACIAGDVEAVKTLLAKKARTSTADVRLQHQRRCSGARV